MESLDSEAAQPVPVCSKSVESDCQKRQLPSRCVKCQIYPILCNIKNTIVRKIWSAVLYFKHFLILNWCFNGIVFRVDIEVL